MPLLKKRSYQRHSEPKLFQCTGYGDCNMVFTRSEHLARHARKHTGEKPFKCAVPGCERTFSRFDNMIQHTSTHSKHHDRKRGPNKKPTTTASTKKAAITTSQRQGNNNPLIIAPNRSRHGSSPSPLLLAPLTSPMNPPTSPLPHIFLPVSPAFEPKSPRSMDYFMHPTFLPSPKDLGLNLPASPLSSVDMPWSPPPLSPPTRKLSNVELDLPIYDLSMSHGVGAYGVHVSGDEFEALQAISQLSSSTIHPCVPTSLSTCSTQVNSFRQHLELAQESYSRLSPRS